MGLALLAKWMSKVLSDATRESYAQQSWWESKNVLRSLDVIIATKQDDLRSAPPLRAIAIQISQKALFLASILDHEERVER